MKFSDSTLAVLKNFASINQSIVFKPGNVLKTVSPQKSVVAIAEIEDEIPSDAVIYDLSRFLSVYSLYKEPDVEFGERAFTIAEGRRRTNYVYADISMVIAPPNNVKFPEADVEVDVAWSDIQAVLKASSALGLPEIAFVGEDGKCYLRALNTDDPSADTFGVEIGETGDS